MLGSWFLLILMLPGWLLPSGLRFSICACAERAAETSSCCVETVAPPCCATRSSDDDSRTDRHTPRVDATPLCVCFVATPDHEGDRALLRDAPACEPLLATRLETPIEWITAPVLVRHADPHRPRGPSPGGSNPLPLRL